MGLQEGQPQAQQGGVPLTEGPHIQGQGKAINGLCPPGLVTPLFLVFQLKWNDGYAGHGEHYYDYNHGDNGYKAPAPYAPAPAYSPPKPAYAGSETDERIVEAPSAFA